MELNSRFEPAIPSQKHVEAREATKKIKIFWRTLEKLSTIQFFRSLSLFSKRIIFLHRTTPHQKEIPKISPNHSHKYRFELNDLIATQRKQSKLEITHVNIVAHDPVATSIFNLTILWRFNLNGNPLIVFGMVFKYSHEKPDYRMGILRLIRRKSNNCFFFIINS